MNTNVKVIGLTRLGFNLDGFNWMDSDLIWIIVNLIWDSVFL